MSITEELRKAINELRVECEEKEGCGVLWYPEPTRDRFSAIADRIDIAHKHAIGYVDDRDPEMMAEHGWMRLPKDADGETIRVGDKVVDWDTPRLVVAVSEDSICLAGYESDSYYRMGIAKNYRHHHVPNVEDVLREFTHVILNQKAEYREQNIAEYAAKLRLAGENE